MLVANKPSNYEKELFFYTSTERAMERPVNIQLLFFTQF